MATNLQFSTTARNDWLADLNTILATSGATLKLYTGTQPASCSATEAGTLLVTFNLTATNPFSTPSSGATTLAGLTLSATTVAAGTAGHFRMLDSAAVCHIQGTVGTSGSDINFDNNVFTSGQTVQITGFTLTAPGA